MNLQHIFTHILHYRLILYYPVSALVTLFANILQNPQDARARSDIKLMDLVVNFLSLLVSDESNMSVKRMLSVCAEFERIAKVVVDRAEKESQSRRKRKVPTENAETPENSGHASKIPPSTARPSDNSSNNAPFSPTYAEIRTANAFDQRNNGIVSPSNPVESQGIRLPEASNVNIPSMSGFSQDFQDILNSNGLGQTGFPDQMALPPGTDGAAGYHFQQPFVPQDLWQMPMTLEWDWADISSSNIATFDQGDIFGGPMQNES
jgi:hypothetical protein